MNVYDDSEGKPLILLQSREATVTHPMRLEQGQGVILDSELRLFFEGVMKLKNHIARDYLLSLVLTRLRRNELR